jgi:putative transcriptional regulator
VPYRPSSTSAHSPHVSRPPRRPRFPDPFKPAARRKGPPPNPLADPLAAIKRPLRALNDPKGPRKHLEFAPCDVKDIRRKFHSTQRRFAGMIGISVETLRNWEQGRRSPHGPSRALLRVAAANPNAVAAVLLRHRRDWWPKNWD